MPFQGKHIEEACHQEAEHTNSYIIHYVYFGIFLLPWEEIMF